VAQQQGVAQARLVFAAACDPRAGELHRLFPPPVQTHSPDAEIASEPRSAGDAAKIGSTSETT
jgi:hypothetical protein